MQIKVLRVIERCEWSGNIRELENRVKRAVIMAEGKQVTLADLDLADCEPEISPMTLKEAREMIERDLIAKTIGRNEGNITNSADDLGISRQRLYELLGKYGISN